MQGTQDYVDVFAYTDGYACKPRHALRLGVHRMDEYRDADMSGFHSGRRRRSGASFGAAVGPRVGAASGRVDGYLPPNQGVKETERSRRSPE